MSSGSVTARVDTWPGKSSSWFFCARSVGAIVVLLAVYPANRLPAAFRVAHFGPMIASKRCHHRRAIVLGRLPVGEGEVLAVDRAEQVAPGDARTACQGFEEPG